MFKKVIRIFTLLFLFLIGIFIFIIFLSGAYFPFLPFYNYYGVKPPDDTWKNFKGMACYGFGQPCVTSEQNQKFEYWTTRAIKENNRKLCNNVGIYDGGDILYADEHGRAIKSCQSLFDSNNSPETWYNSTNSAPLLNSN